MSPSKSKKWAAIINPVSGGGRGADDWPVIEGLLRDNGIVPECLFTEHKYHAIELTVSAVNRGYRNIIAIGGDGTLHEVVNGLFIQQAASVTDISIGVMSLGTGNDWGRTYGFPREYEEAVKIIAAGHTFLQDVGRVDYFESNYPQARYFVNVAGLGFDSAVIRNYDKLKEDGRTGKILYMWSLLKALLGYRSGRMKIEVDGIRKTEGRIFSIAVGIGRFNGGGFMQLPRAIPDDGLLDLTSIRKIGKLNVVSKIKTLFNGTIYGVRQASHDRGRHIVIEAGQRTRAEADGELLGTSPFEFTILQKALRVIVPHDFPGK